MMRSSRSGDSPPEESHRPRIPARLTGVIALESIALGIAIALPVTPSKTGSTWSPAHIFSPDPTYLEKVAASFVLVNVLFLVLGLVALVLARWDASK